MGVKGLFKYIRDNDLVETVDAAQYAGKTVAVDLCHLICTLKSVPNGKSTWRAAFERRHALLAHLGIGVVYVADGTDNAEAKAECHVERAARPRILEPEDIAFVEGAVAPSQFAVSSGEGEHYCVAMVQMGFADYVLTGDADAFLLGAPCVIVKMSVLHDPNTGQDQGAFEMVDTRRVLRSLGLAPRSLLDAAIMVGTDFNVGGVPRIQMKTAINLMAKHGTFAQYCKVKQYTPDFDYGAVVALMRVSPAMKMDVQERFDDFCGDDFCGDDG